MSSASTIITSFQPARAAEPAEKLPLPIENQKIQSVFDNLQDVPYH
jgi:hypothetical protein